MFLIFFKQEGETSTPTKQRSGANSCFMHTTLEFLRKGFSTEVLHLQLSTRRSKEAAREDTEGIIHSQALKQAR